MVGLGLAAFLAASCCFAVPSQPPDKADGHAIRGS